MSRAPSSAVPFAYGFLLRVTSGEPGDRRPEFATNVWTWEPGDTIIVGPEPKYGIVLADLEPPVSDPDASGFLVVEPL